MSRRLVDAIDAAVETHAGRPALIQPGKEERSVTYGELGDRAGALASALGAHLSETESLGIFARRSIEHVAYIYGALLAGVPYFSINQASTPNKVVAMAETANAGLIVIDNAALLKLGRVEPEMLRGLRLLHVSEGPFSAAHEAMLAKLSGAVEVISEEDFLVAGETGPRDAAVESDPVGCMLFTSGSTGTPKGVRIAASDLAERAASERASYELSADDVLMNVLPFSFDVGCNQLHSCLTSGATLVIQNSWLSRDILGAIQAYGVTGLSGVPAIWEIVFGHDEDEARTALAGLRYLTISGGDLDEAGRQRLRALAPGAGIFKTYGQTETFRSGMLLPDEFASHPGSVGRPPAGVQVYIVDGELNELPPGEVGQIVHQGVGTMLGYAGDPEATERKVVTVSLGGSDGRAVLTGDRGVVDTEGYLTVLGRSDRMLKIRGNRVYPEEVEAELRAHPSVSSAVVMVLDSGEGPKLTAGVVVEGDAPDPMVLRRFAASRLVAFMVPERIVVCDPFPRTATGKIDFSAARDAIRRVVDSEAGVRA